MLNSGAQALVNTVNTVGVMGKGIALMFKERFPQNFQAYAAACKEQQVSTGTMFVTETGELTGPRWIVNFPTKQHWRGNSRMEWVVEGLVDLRRWLIANQVQSIAIPPLGAGNGGLNWEDVRPQIEKILESVDTEVIVYEPTEHYQNVQKRSGVDTLTPARALISELVRRYSILGMECSILEIQKLSWFLERSLHRQNLESPLRLQFKPHFYGPYSDSLKHLLNSLDGSYIHCAKRIADADPWEPIWFDDAKEPLIGAYLRSDAKKFLPALNETTELIDGFQSPFGLELLATCDWLINEEHVAATVPALRDGLARWPSESWAVARKVRIFNDQMLYVALERLDAVGRIPNQAPTH